ncbi:MAG: transporter substrate-binding domain-containing protein, partial [Mailhella sp.]|nr:transporter substrate-binding domain-containing protein [Mailhella sp.]
MKTDPGKKCRITVQELLAFACAVFLAAALHGTAHAAPETKTVRVGYYENEVFQEGARKDAVKTGYAYEYYRKLSEYTGWKYDYVYGGFKDLYQMLLDGRIDLLAGLAWQEERGALIRYPDAPMGRETYSLVKHGSDEDITADPATLNGKR